MPGFLGTEKQFVAKYGKPILQSRDAKSSSKEQEAGKKEMIFSFCLILQVFAIVVYRNIPWIV